jgi:hypothetical protein
MATKTALTVLPDTFNSSIQPDSINANNEIKRTEIQVEDLVETNHNSQSFTDAELRSSVLTKSIKIDSIRIPESTKRNFLQINETGPQESFE